MKKNIFIALAALVICSSCNDNYYLSETEQDLAQLSSEYDDAKLNEEEDEGEKIETLASEDEIKASMDEYKTMLMNRASVAKERVTRTAYAASNPVVGVFKVNSCGNNTELRLTMDCEDRRDDSYTTGNVGASYVEGGNVNFVFCLTNANRYYPGGVLLVDHINYDLALSHDHITQRRQMDVIVRYHDTEDNNPSNVIHTIDPYYVKGFGGYSSVGDDVTLAWGFPIIQSFFNMNFFFGPGDGIQYGVLSRVQAATGSIHCDDEDKNNKNWIQRYKLGKTLDTSFTDVVALSSYGIAPDGNTNYSVCLSTDPKFKSNNVFYPSKVQ